jgi:hypothetical protein
VVTFFWHPLLQPIGSAFCHHCVSHTIGLCVSLRLTHYFKCSLAHTSTGAPLFVIFATSLSGCALTATAPDPCSLWSMWVTGCVTVPSLPGVPLCGLHLSACFGALQGPGVQAIIGTSCSC